YSCSGDSLLVSSFSSATDSALSTSPKIGFVCVSSDIPSPLSYLPHIGAAELESAQRHFEQPADGADRVAAGLGHQRQHEDAVALGLGVGHGATSTNNGASSVMRRSPMAA